MKLARGAVRRTPGSKSIVSRADAMALMIISAVAAVATTAMTVSGIAAYFTGPVTLTLPLTTTRPAPTDLHLGAQAHFTSVETAIPALPTGEAALLAWSGALNQLSALAVMALLFLLAFRLRGENLFTAGSASVVGSCGAVLALAGSAGQVLDQVARGRLAEAIRVNARAAGESVTFMGSLNFAPVVAGFVLILVAGVFQFGGRLQKDTEGLV
ncbi:hypothetical protein ACFVYC_13695 [Pseudarthrobacter sp. NPDC058329]|uniref:hypothetical protein n=1 Tax=Pseudarthrobacter sp. NPDC058329 TaxID=3346448 RepID=UPI0036D9AB79